MTNTISETDILSLIDFDAVVKCDTKTTDCSSEAEWHGRTFCCDYFTVLCSEHLILYKERTAAINERAAMAGAVVCCHKCHESQKPPANFFAWRRL